MSRMGTVHLHSTSKADEGDEEARGGAIARRPDPDQDQIRPARPSAPLLGRRAHPGPRTWVEAGWNAKRILHALHFSAQGPSANEVPETEVIDGICRIAALRKVVRAFQPHHCITRNTANRPNTVAASKSGCWSDGNLPEQTAEQWGRIGMAAPGFCCLPPWPPMHLTHIIIIAFVAEIKFIIA